MKKMMLMVALAGFTAACGYAQNSTYICTEKIVHNNEIPIVDEWPTTGKLHYYYQDTEVRNITLVTPEVLVPAPVETESCYRYNENNIMVTRCPDKVYKSDDKNVYEYNEDGVYLGYYPVQKTTVPAVVDENMTCVKVEPVVTLPHVIYKWVVPANGNARDKNCSPQ